MHINKPARSAQFTPGPWKAMPDRSRNMFAWSVEGAKGVVPTIARLSLIDACEEIEGNAHLIAAAPVMYEALKMLLKHEGERAVSGIGTEHDSEALETAKIIARTALAQAEGVDHE